MLRIVLHLILVALVAALVTGTLPLPHAAATTNNGSSTRGSDGTSHAAVQSPSHVQPQPQSREQYQPRSYYRFEDAADLMKDSAGDIHLSAAGEAVPSARTQQQGGQVRAPRRVHGTPRLPVLTCADLCWPQLVLFRAGPNSC